MKEETKKKLCKISKIVGFAITFGFAVFGVLCAAMLIGNGSKKDDIITLDSSLVLNEVRTERNNKPRKAPDFNPDANLFTRKDYGYNLQYVDGGGLGIVAGNSYNVLYSAVVDKGLYYYKSTYSPVHALTSAVSFNNSLNGAIDGTPVAFSPISYSGTEKDIYVYVPDDNMFFVADTYDGWIPEMYLVDTLVLPASSSISFPESFSPLGLFGDSVTNNGGYVYLPNASGNELDIEITGLIFKYGGVVYDGIHIECVRALSMGYINDDGQLVKQGVANDYMWALSWIKFYQRYKGQSPQDGIVVVMAELKSVTDNANDMPVAFTGRTQWVNRSDRTIQIIDDLGTTTGRYDGRYSDMTDKKLMEWVSSSFSVGNSLGVMGNNSVFDIFTNAFDSVLPILSIAILPNITLGMLLFIPLIGAIIVIIIRVVKK